MIELNALLFLYDVAAGLGIALIVLGCICAIALGISALTRFLLRLYMRRKEQVWLVRRWSVQEKEIARLKSLLDECHGEKDAS